MAETFEFEVDTPLETEDAVTTVRCYESDDGATDWTLVDSILLADLTPDGAGVYTWPSALADSSKYHQLIPVSLALVERSVNEILPPRGADPTTFTLYCYTKDLGLGVVSGVRLQAGRVSAALQAGSNTIVAPVEDITDENGYAQLSLPADIGTIPVTIGSVTKQISTTGLGGTAVNLANYL